MCLCMFVFFKQKTAYEMRISDWSSDVCSSDLLQDRSRPVGQFSQLQRVEPAFMLMRGEGRGEMHRVTAAATQPLGLFDFADFGHLLSDRFLYPGIESQRRSGTSITGPQKTDHCLVARYLDRKSVVSGKSVSERVDLGGRRYF